jgi:carbonic anhydrase/acetyltransferase-like protein (isoleucine patch superfamily)
MFRKRYLIGAAFAASLALVALSVAQNPPQQAPAQKKAQAGQSRRGLHIDPTAEVHPSVILEGNITIGAFTQVDAGTILLGNITIGHHSVLRCNNALRGNIQIGNYVSIYDNVNIEGGRPALVGSSQAKVNERAIIGNFAWINHGATMHGTIIDDYGAVGINTGCDYATHIGRGAVLANGSATHVGQDIPANSFAEGVPAVVKKLNITDKDRLEYFGLIPEKWALYEGAENESDIRKKLGMPPAPANAPQ